MNQTIGIIMLIAISAGLISITVVAAGWKVALTTWGITIFITAWIVGGVYLVNGGW